MTAPVPAPDRDRETAIERESIEDALENDRCGICGSVDHFREDCLTPADLRCCARCGDAVQYLSSDDLCDACVDEADGAEDR